MAKKTTKDTKELKKITCEYKDHKGKRLISEANFYKSKSPMFPDGRVHVCKKCLKNMIDYNDMETIYRAFQILDIPFFYNRWKECESRSGNRDIFGNYVRMANSEINEFKGARYSDSVFKPEENIKKNKIKEMSEEDIEKEAIFKQNKIDAIKMLGYDPFEKESKEDQPKLYATLINMMTEDLKEDVIKTGATLDVIRTRNQIEKIDDAIVTLNRESGDIIKNMTSVNSLIKTKETLTKTLNNTIKENKMVEKRMAGANSFTGKENKMNNLNLEAIQVNMYDQGTSYGMQQVAIMSLRASIKELNFGDDTLSEIVKEQSMIIDNFRKEYKSLKEENRRLKALCNFKGVDYREYILKNDWGEELNFNKEEYDKSINEIDELEKQVEQISVDKYADRIIKEKEEENKRKIKDKLKNND